MRPIEIVPQPVPQPSVRRLDGGVHEPTPVQQVAVRPVPAPCVVPRQLDPVAVRLRALQLENEDLRAALDELRTA